jgi:hypothetical protein
VESQETAEVDEKRIVAASQTWGKLTNQEKLEVARATGAIYGTLGIEALEEEMSLRSA